MRQWIALIESETFINELDETVAVPHDCLTPGTFYDTVVSDNKIDISVKLPSEISVNDASEDQIASFEDDIHDALEGLVAKLISEIDPEADDHWAEAKLNDD